MAKILLIEDDSGIILPLSLYLEKENHSFIVCRDGNDALDFFSKEKPDLILLDINLPHKSGITICEEIRQNSLVPILVISARWSESDKLKLFELGVDDYITKPFSSKELMARISAVLKRVEIQKKPRNWKNVNFWAISLNSKQMLCTCDNQELELTKTEFSILEYCIKNSQNVIKREAIMRDVMGYDNYIYDRTIDTHIKNIRKKIYGKITIETIRWVGYRFDPAPENEAIS